MFSEKVFADRLRALRKDKSINQPQLAELMGIAKQTENSWENCTRTPPVKKLWELADYFDVSIDYLVGRSDDPERR